MTEASWNQLLGSLNLFDRWSAVHEWKETHDLFYTVRGETVRTTRSADSDGNLVVAHQRKKRVDETKLDVQDCRIVDGIKVSLNTEERVDNEEMKKRGPFEVMTTNVRIKQRKSFEWNDWRFDVTKSWSGRTYKEAKEAKEKNHCAQFEFEIELIDPDKFLNKPNHSNEYVAACLVLRIAGVLPEQKCRIRLL